MVFGLDRFVRPTTRRNWAGRPRVRQRADDSPTAAHPAIRPGDPTATFGPSWQTNPAHEGSKVALHAQHAGQVHCRTPNCDLRAFLARHPRARSREGRTSRPQRPQNEPNCDLRGFLARPSGERRP